MSDTAGHTHSMEHLLKLSSTVSKTATASLIRVEHICPAQTSLLDYISCFRIFQFQYIICFPLSFKVYLERNYIIICQNSSG